jgi:very-short-patch-repair endonuclease
MDPEHPGRVSVVEMLAEIGGVASRATLLGLSSRLRVDRALACGDVVIDARGRYALPAADDARRAAGRLTGVVSHLSAAMAWGWEVKTPPSRPHVTIPKSRKIEPSRRKGVTLHRANLGSDDVDDLVTSPLRTLLDCLRTLPFDEALTVADSALRHRAVDRGQLVELASAARGPGSAQVKRVARLATGKAANPFESCLRAIAVDVPGLHVQAQVPIGGDRLLGTPDLVDVELAIAIEADSFAWHGGRTALHQDARRYNSFVVAGWLVLRFAYEDVMSDPAWVRSILEAAVQERTEDRRCPTCAA